MNQESMSKISTSLIVEMMSAKDVITKCEAICEFVKRGCHSERADSILDSLKFDKTPFWNSFLVSDFACAALHLLGKEKYDGKREEIRNLIASNLDFS